MKIIRNLSRLLKFSQPAQWLKLLSPKQRLFVSAIALAIIVILLPVVVYSLLHVTKAEAAWFDTNWGFRKAVPVTSTEGATQNNVFVSFTLDTATPISAGKMQTNCQDIRITDGSGNLLKYHIGRATACNNSATGIDFLLASFPNGQSTYYVYYGNPSAKSNDAGSLTVNQAGASTVTASGNEITDAVRTINTQGDGVTPPDSSYGIWQAATNLVTNGGFETNTTGWGTGGTNTAVQSTERAKFGSSSLKITYQNSLLFANTGITLTNAAYMWSVWIYIPSSYTPNSGGVVQVGLANFTGVTGTTTANANLALRDQWQRVVVGPFTPAVGDLVGNPQIYETFNYPNVGNFIYIDGAQIELGSIATPYVETNGSTAARSASRVQGPASVFNQTQGWIAARLRMGWANTASFGALTPGLFDWRLDGSNILYIEYSPSTGNWVLARRNTGGSQAVTKTATFAKGDLTTVVFAWTATTLYASVNGSAFTSIGGTTYIPALSAITPDIGDLAGSGAYAIDSDVLWFASGVGTLTNTDAATINGWGNTDPTTTQLNGLNSGLAAPTLVWNANTTADTQTSYSQAPARNYTIGTLATEEAGLAPVAYWKFDEGYGTVAHDSSSNGNNGTLSGSTIPTWQSADQCISGKCLYFDGASSKLIGSKIVKNVQSVSFWVKPITLTSTTGLIDLDGGTHTITANASGVVAANNFSSAAIYVNGKTSGSLTVNQWNHVEVTTGVGFDSTASIQVGTNNTNYTKGYFDEVKIYGYARSSAQVLVDYNSRGSQISAGNTLGASAYANLTNGLVGYWKMDEATWSGTLNEVVDSSRNGNNGTATKIGNDPTTANGKFGNGGTFPGVTDYAGVIIANSASLTIPGDVTVSAWIKPSSSYTDSMETVLREGIYADELYSIVFQASTKQIIFSWYDGSFKTFNSTGTIPYDTWNHIVITRSGTNISIYINGKLDRSSNTGTTPTYTTPTMRLGSSGSYLQDYSGMMDEVRVYNRALSQTEVEQLYNWGPSPVLNYNFEEGQGSTVNDISGNGNSGNWSGTGGHWTQGKYGKAGNFNGTNDYVTAGTDSSINNITGAIAVEAWIYPRITSGIHYYLSNTGDVGSSLSGYGLRSNYSCVNSFEFQIRKSDNTAINANACGALSQANQWYHVVGTFDGTTVKIIVNGVVKGSTNSSGTMAGPANNTTTIGRLATGNWYYTNGVIDEVKVYNYARTAKQIVEDMNGGHPAGGSPVGSAVGYWKFDEGYGTTTNNSGNGGSILNGVLGNGTIWTNDGKFGKALSFTNSSIVVPSSSALSQILTNHKFTYSAWVNPKAYATGLDIMGFNGYSPHWGYSFILTNTGNLNLTFQDNAGTWYYINSTKFSIPLNKWSYVAVTFDNSTGKIIFYYNGTSEIINNSVIDDNTGTGFRISLTGWHSFTGLIDEVKVYNYALSSSEIKIDYNHSSALVLGATSDTSGLAGGSVASNSASAAYCVPGGSDPCSSPVGEWNFEEGQGSTVNDTSGNNNTMSWNGTAPYWGQGKYGSGGNFNGTDSYTSMTTNNTTFDASTNTITVEGWVYPKTGTFILASKAGVTSGWFLQDNASNNLSFFAKHGDNTNAISRGSSITIPLNKWSHFAAVITLDTATLGNNNVDLYVNGVLNEGSMTLTSLPVVSSTVLKMGVRGTTPQDFANGKIDGMKIFNYGRSAAQVAWDYNRGGPVGWWKFDECQGTTAYDSSGNGNNGTIVIGPTAPQTTAGTCLAPTDGSGAWYDGASGKFNSSLNFDGVDDYVNVGVGAGTLDHLGNTFTIAAWIKTPIPNSRMTIFSTGYSGNGPVFGTSANTPGGLEIYFPSVFVANTTGSLLPTNTWVHVAYTRSGTGAGTHKFYINGASQPLAYDTGNNFIDTSVNKYIGQRGDGTYFKGQIDDVRIYNYALTQDQIQQVYNQGAAVRFGPLTGTP